MFHFRHTRDHLIYLCIRVLIVLYFILGIVFLPAMFRLFWPVVHFSCIPLAAQKAGVLPISKISLEMGSCLGMVVHPGAAIGWRLEQNRHAVM
jgi:hypothetical protein